MSQANFTRRGKKSENWFHFMEACHLPLKAGLADRLEELNTN